MDYITYMEKTINVIGEIPLIRLYMLSKLYDCLELPLREAKKNSKRNKF